MKSLQELLGYVPMTTMARRVIGGVPDVLPPAFSSGTSRKVIGNTVQYNAVYGHQRTAIAVQYGQKAHEIQPDQIAQATATLVHTFETFSHNPLVLQNLWGLNGEGPAAVAADLVDYNLKELGRRPATLRTASRYLALFGGKIWFDGQGNLLANSSGAAVTVDFGVPAANQGQLGGLIDTTWTNAAANIPQMINKIKDDSVAQRGYQITTAFYGANILTDLLANTQASNLIKANPVLQNAVYNRNEIPNGFCGLNWVPAHGAFFKDKNNATVRPCGAGEVVFTPDPTPDWWEHVEGSMLVPSTIDIVSDIDEAMKSFTNVYGPFAYGQVSINPPTIAQFFGDTYLCLLKVPAAIYQATVEF